MNTSSQKSSVGNSLSCLVFRPLAQKDSKGNNKARDIGPLPPLREQVDGEHESAVQTFTQSRLMGGCELIDLSSTRSNKLADGARLDVDLGLIGLRPEQLWSRLFLIKPDLQLNISSAITINPTLLTANAHQLIPSAMKNHQDCNNGLQGNADDFYHAQDHDLFASVSALGNNVPPIANNISSCNGANLPADSSCYSLQYIDLDAFQAEIVGLSRNQHQQQQVIDVNTNDLDVASTVRKVQHQSGTSRKRKQNKAPVERNISCSQCPRKFRSAGHLKLHFNSAHPSDGAISKCHCDICGKGFCHGGALALHKRRHT